MQQLTGILFVLAVEIALLFVPSLPIPAVAFLFLGIVFTLAMVWLPPLRNAVMGWARAPNLNTFAAVALGSVGNLLLFQRNFYWASICLASGLTAWLFWPNRTPAAVQKLADRHLRGGLLLVARGFWLAAGVFMVLVLGILSILWILYVRPLQSPEVVAGFNATRVATFALSHNGVLVIQPDRVIDSALWLYEQSGYSPHEIPVDNDRVARHPAFSNDGSLIAYVVRSVTGSEPWMLDVLPVSVGIAGSRAVGPTLPWPRFFQGHVSWPSFGERPGGGLILTFAAETTDGTARNLFYSLFSPSGVWTEPVQVPVRTEWSYNDHPVPYGNGRFIAFQTCKERSEEARGSCAILGHDLETRNTRPLVDHGEAPTVVGIGPDTQYLVFTKQDAPGALSFVGIRGLARSGRQGWASYWNDHSPVSVAPQSAKLAFATERWGLGSVIYRVDLTRQVVYDDRPGSALLVWLVGKMPSALFQFPKYTKPLNAG